jgi:RNA polymerase sigma-70 factor (ECF subfamily)
MDDWQEAVRDASQGDEAAIDRMLEAYLPQLRGFVRLRMGPELRAKESASDLVQSTCREVLGHLDRFQHGGEVQFRRWLFTTALRKIKNKLAFYRASNREQGREVAAPGSSDNLGALAGVYGGMSTPSAEVMAREQIERLELAFDGLSEDHRKVITLARIVGLPHKDIAAEMGRSESATRMLLFRALGQLGIALRSRSTT